MVPQSSIANSVKRHKVVETLIPPSRPGSRPPHFSPTGSKIHEKPHSLTLSWNWHLSARTAGKVKRWHAWKIRTHTHKHTHGQLPERAMPDTHSSVSNVMYTLLITPRSTTVWSNVNVSYHRAHWSGMIWTEHNKWVNKSTKCVTLPRHRKYKQRERCLTLIYHKLYCRLSFLLFCSRDSDWTPFVRA